MRYDYKCTNDKCNEVFEVEKPMVDVHREEKCPKCTAIADRVYLTPIPFKMK